MSRPADGWGETERQLRDALGEYRRYVREGVEAVEEFLDNNEFGLAFDEMARAEWVPEVEFWRALTRAARSMLEPRPAPPGGGVR